MLDIEELKKLIYIDDNGCLRWFPRTVDMFKDSGHKTALQYCNGWNARFANQLALWNFDGRYRKGKIAKVVHMYHRALFMLHHDRNIKEGYVIDHIDGNVLNNSIVNLREVTIQDNNKNVRLSKVNTSGHIGIAIVNNKWRVKIKVDSKSKHIGYYSSLEDAIMNRDIAYKKYGYHENHGKR